MKPLFKWAGNKYRIIERIKKVLPQGDRLIEPFAGSAAVFLNTSYDHYIINDINIDLINFYNLLKNEKHLFIDYCFTYFSKENNTSDAYYRLRDIFNTTNDIREKSALFLYLNRHAYNGLCRYNKQGKFNTPFGRYKNPYFPEREMLDFISKCEKCNVEFTNKDFREVMKKAVKGDVIYCDPPYVPLSSTANFTDYSQNGFTIQDQIDLTNLAMELANRGIPVIISNHSTVSVIEAYREAKIYHFTVRRTISCNGNKRENAPEILAVFG